MKRLITFIFLIVIIWAGYTFINKGFKNDKLNVASYKTIEKKSEALTKKLASYNKKNEKDYQTAVDSLDASIKTYKTSKEKYEEIYEELAEVLNKDNDSDQIDEVLEEVIYSDKEKYKVDFLLVTLGDYGGKNGVDVVYQLTTSSTIDQNATTLNYFLSDLKFTVSGEYINVANFISDLENDDKLNWEIRNFTMESGGKGVTATFTVKDVPIDSESYLDSSSMSSTGSEQPTTDPNNVTNNDNNNTNTVANTTSNTTNTVNNVSNNTVGATNTISNNTVSIKTVN